MKTLKELIQAFKQDFTKALDTVKNQDELEKVRVAFLGRKSALTNLMVHMKTLAVDEKRIYGPLLNDLKKSSETDYNKKITSLKASSYRQKELQYKHFDVTAYNLSERRGGLHIYTQILTEIKDIFISMGYQVADGNEVETDYYNFEALNIPKNHPARDMQDTFWLDVPGLLMRTQTSPIQIHAMQKEQGPVALIAPGRVYRNEATDASHDFMFTQVEGLFVGENVSMANLLATLKLFLQKIFKKDDLKIRVRPGFFPFVEPGIEVDFSCTFCSSGCSVCKKTGWIELMGAGLVHPNVLRCGKIDPEKYSGFAFGLGIERLAMIKYGINDIRLFHGNSLQFLKQF